MAEACKPVEGFEAFAGGQTAVSNAVKNTWLGPVAAKVVALDRLAALNAPRNAWLRHIGLWRDLKGLRAAKRQSGTP